MSLTAERWYLKDGTGAACGPGTRFNLAQFPPRSIDLNQDVTTENTWNRTEVARTIPAGNWTVQLRVTTGTGGGAPNRVTVVVERRNSSCTVQQTIGTVESGNLTAGTTENVTLDFGDPGAVTFSSGDILTCRIVRSNGTRTQTVKNTNLDTWLQHPHIADGTLVPAGSASVAEGTTTSLSFSHTVPTGTDRLLNVGVGSWDQLPTSVTFNSSETLTAEASVRNTTGGASAWNGRRIAPTETTANVVVAFAASEEVVAVAVNLVGVHQTTPAQSTGTSAPADPVNVSINLTSQDDGLCTDIISCFAPTTACEFSTNQRLAAGENNGGGTQSGVMSLKKGATSVTMSVNGLAATDDPAYAAVAWQPPAAATPIVKPVVRTQSVKRAATY